ncbi:hypothetical protein M8J76_005842 [Diaphorina citri]|nr:hypothetical protein M8J76_005842 [Diaphorina citri]
MMMIMIVLKACVRIPLLTPCAGLGSVPPPTPTPAPPTPSPQALIDNNVTTIINNVASDVASNNHVIVQHIPQSSLIHEQVIPQPTPPPPTPQQPLRSATPQQITIAAPINSNPATLELTREQMVQAQEMFKNANIVSRTEKALILGFMAGTPPVSVQEINVGVPN